MQRLNEVVDIYLNMDTNYALLITGEWGTGKTYYFKKNLKGKISKTKVYSDQSKDYRPILISLFGLKSIEEIQSEIFLSLYPILKDKKLKLAASIGKAIAKGILHLKGLSDYTTFVEGIDINKGNLIKFEELVICFDDLERISKDLNLEEFIGYVNSLVENDNIKILIIANQEKIEAENYNVLKEKVIGNSVEFIPNFKESYDDILKSKFSSAIIYKEFLENNKDFVLENFTKKSNNLRTLIFILSYFHLIYSEIKNQLFYEDNLKEKETEIILNLFKFTIAISIEYKEGKITFKQRNELDKTTAVDWALLISDSQPLKPLNEIDKDVEKTYKEIFTNKYYIDDKFYFYSSIYDYITGGTKFEYSILIDELKRVYHIQDNIIQPQYEVYDKLSYPKCFSLKDNEYKKETKKMLEYAYNGNYDLTMYLTIFHYATRFDNPLNFKLDKLEKMIIKGMIRGKASYKYDRDLKYQLQIFSEAEHTENLKNIRTAALDLNNEIQHEIQTSKATELEKLCYENFVEFYTKVLDNQQSFCYQPIFSSFSVNKFYSFFHNSEPMMRWDIVGFFKERYTTYPSFELKAEIPFLEKLKQLIEKKNKSLSGKNITGFVYKEFEKQLLSTIKTLNSLSS